LQILAFAQQTSLFTVFGHSALNRRFTSCLFGVIKSFIGLLVGRVVVAFATSYPLDVVSAVSWCLRLFGFLAWCFKDYHVASCLASVAATASPFCRQRR
jgi:vacuolar-type H+-ATPase subunit I/STV1